MLPRVQKCPGPPLSHTASAIPPHPKHKLPSCGCPGGQRQKKPSLALLHPHSYFEVLLVMLVVEYVFRNLRLLHKYPQRAQVHV